MREYRWSPPSAGQMSPPVLGYYINMDSNPDREQRLLGSLQAQGVRHWYARERAVDGRTVAERHATELDPGNLGCWLSHLSILQRHLKSDRDLHVFEDDSVLCESFASQFSAVCAFLETERDAWDIALTDAYIAPNLDQYGRFSRCMKRYDRDRAVSVIPLQAAAFAGGTSSILVNRDSIEKYFQLMRDGWKSGLPIDIYLRKLINRGKLSAKITVPFLTSVSELSAASDIRGQFDPSRIVLQAYRRAFFVDANPQELLHDFPQFSTESVSQRDRLFLKTVEFLLSDAYRSF